MPQKSENKLYVNFMLASNGNYLKLFRLFCWLNLGLLIYCIFRKKLLENAALLAIIALNYYLFFSSGISFYQGDRLVISALPVWIVCYTVLWWKIVVHVRKWQTRNSSKRS